LEYKTMGNKQAVLAVQGKANELEGKIQALEKGLKETQGGVQALQGTIDNQKATIEQQKAVIEQNKVSIASLQHVADELSVIRVINQLATDINGRDFKSVRELFDEYVEYDEYCVSQEHPRSKLAGEDLADNLKKSEGVYKGISWIFTSPQVSINGDEASVSCQFRANHFQAHNEKGVDFLENQGTFRQVLVRKEGTWKIKSWKYITLAYQSGNPRLHDIAAKYAAQYGPPPSPAPRSSTSHMNVGVAIVMPGKNPADLKKTAGPQEKKEEKKVEVEKVALKKTELVKKEEPAKVEIPKTRLASSSMGKKEGATSISSPEAASTSILAAPPSDTPAPTPAVEPAPVAASEPTPVFAADPVPEPAPTPAEPEAPASES